MDKKVFIDALEVLGAERVFAAMEETIIADSLETRLRSDLAASFVERVGSICGRGEAYLVSTSTEDKVVKAHIEELKPLIEESKAREALAEDLMPFPVDDPGIGRIVD